MGPVDAALMEKGALIIVVFDRTSSPSACFLWQSPLVDVALTFHTVIMHPLASGVKEQDRTGSDQQPEVVKVPRNLTLVEVKFRWKETT